MCFRRLKTAYKDTKKAAAKCHSRISVIKYVWSLHNRSLFWFTTAQIKARMLHTQNNAQTAHPSPHDALGTPALTPLMSASPLFSCLPEERVRFYAGFLARDQTFFPRLPRLLPSDVLLYMKKEEAAVLYPI